MSYLNSIPHRITGKCMLTSTKEYMKPEEVKKLFDNEVLPYLRFEFLGYSDGWNYLQIREDSSMYRERIYVFRSNKYLVNWTRTFRYDGDLYFTTTHTIEK